jgi:hypothetical protein
MADRSIYITDDQYDAILLSLNVTFTDDTHFDVLDRAVADFEGDMVERFTVPLAGVGVPFSSVADFARNKALNAMKAKIRQILGNDNARNVVVESTQRYVDVQKSVYEDQKKALLDPKRIWGFQMQAQAQDAVTPIQSVGIARARNERREIPDCDI